MSIERLGVAKVLEDPSLKAYADLILHLYQNRSDAAAVDSQVAKLVLGEGRAPQRFYVLLHRRWPGFRQGSVSGVDLASRQLQRFR